MLNILYQNVFELLDEIINKEEHNIDIYNGFKTNSNEFPYICFSLYETTFNNEFNKSIYTLTIDVFDKNTDNTNILNIVDSITKDLNNKLIENEEYYLLFKKYNYMEVTDNAENVRHFVLRFMINSTFI